MDAAIDVFGEKGFDRANVEDIAQAAGIGKGTVYLYFKSKEEIFSAIVAGRTLLPRATSLMAATDISLEASLTKLAESYLKFMSENLPFVQLVFSDSRRFPAHAKRVYTETIFKGNKMLADFLVTQTKAGKVRKLNDPLITARAFIGMLLIYTLTQEMLGGKQLTPIKREAWVKEVVRLFLDGIRP